MNQVSEFIFTPIGDTSETFTEFSQISSSGFNVLCRAKRGGQWWMLKALRFDVCQNSTYQQLLQKEYDILSRLNNPGIVKVEGFEEVAGYGKCIVMEWIDGVTLDEWLNQKHSLAERKRVARQLLDTLEYVHDQQVVHRDLKPSNIMITHNGATLKLIDFGLADADNYAILKSPAGTSGYISPEQQKDSTPDVRNDIYSLGVILREMHLSLSYRWAIKRCLAPIEQRYPNIAVMYASLRSFHLRFIAVSCLLACLLLGVSSFAIYNKVVKPHTLYDVVTEFTIGNLEYKSWGGGLVTVSAANVKDSVIEIPATVHFQGVTYHVDEVEDSAFAAHPLLKRIVLPDNPHIHMMKHVFDGSHHLESISFRSKIPPTLGNAIWEVTMSQVFAPQCFASVILYIPKGCLAAYRQSPWGRFEHIEEYE